MSKDRQVIEIERNMTNRYYAEEKKMVPGFGTSVRSRPLIISKLDTYMRAVLTKNAPGADNEPPGLNDFDLLIRSKRMIEELRVFIWENGKAQAMQGYNDDLVMALSIGLWVRDTALRLEQEGVELTKNAIQGFRKRTIEEEVVYKPSNLNHDPYSINVGNNPFNPQVESLRWLF